MYRKSNGLVGFDDEPISPEPLDLSPSHTNSLNHAPNNFKHHDGGIDPKSTRLSRFAELPTEVIHNILWAVDANSFASLCMLNRQWHHESQNVELYAYHLSRCPSYALCNNVITGPFRSKNDLARLKAKFAAEVRRNLFDAYTRPRRTLINLISINANSAAAFPGGEAFRFEFSPNGRTILALSSSRIYVLDATVDPIMVRRELKTLRRPLSASITDDGTLLAVLSSKFQANIYGIEPDGQVQHIQCIALENSPRTIAIAHEGTVLAAAYETGVEVFSLASNALTTDRRAVRSEAVDTLNFSGDGSMLVGSALSLDEPNAVIISAPFYTENDPELSPREAHSRMWTTQILFPQISSVCSHVSLLPGHSEGDATWLFAYDHSLLSYRAVRTDDTRSGVAYFHGPPGANRFSMPPPTIAPTATACGTLVVAGFGGVGLCLYGIPEKLDVGPDMAAVVERHESRLQVRGPITSATGHMEPLMAYSPSVSGTSESIEDDALASKVDWRQSLFVKCKTLTSMSGHTAAKWVEKIEEEDIWPYEKRLLVVAPGGVGNFAPDLGEETMPVDGSRLCLLDFDYNPSSGGDREITIEVGDSLPDVLDEPAGNMATEVALERKRTIRQMPGTEHSRMLLARSITAISPPSASFGNEWKPRSNSQPSSPVEETSERRLNASPLQRSATAAGFRHALYPPRPPLGSQQVSDTNGVPGMGRATSVDSWESPPPPYTDAGAGGGPGAPVPSGQPGQPIPNPGLTQSPGLTFSHSALPGSPDFAPSASPPQMQNYMPYRHMHPRQSTGLDGMPSSEAAPTRRTMSQYGAFQRSPRFREPNMPSLDTVAEAWHRQAVRSMDLSSTSSDMGGQNIDAHFARPRPLTHHGGGSQTSPRSPADRSPQNSSNPISPISSKKEYSPTSPEGKARLSLTGANLKNRLNHPVPPVPEEVPDIPVIPSTLRPNTETAQPHSAPPITANALVTTNYPSIPPILQTGNLNNLNNNIPQHQPHPAPGLAPVTASLPRRPVGSPASQPQASWGPPVIANDRSSFQPAHNFSNAFAPQHQQPHPQFNTGHANARSALTSASVPNLLPAVHHRHDNSMSGDYRNAAAAAVPSSSGLSRRVSRAQSLIHRSRPQQQREQSAYAETAKTTPVFSFGRRAKADKKKPTRVDSDGSKKGLRDKCSVM